MSQAYNIFDQQPFRYTILSVDQRTIFQWRTRHFFIRLANLFFFLPVTLTPQLSPVHGSLQEHVNLCIFSSNRHDPPLRQPVSAQSYHTEMKHPEIDYLWKNITFLFLKARVCKCKSNIQHLIFDKLSWECLSLERLNFSLCREKEKARVLL